MQIKRFEGREMQDVLGQVKEVLGPEAIILSTKKRRGTFSPFRWRRQPLVEIVAAIDRDPFPSSLESRHFFPGGSRTGSEEDHLVQKILSAGICPDFVFDLVREIKDIRQDLNDWSLLEVYRSLLYWKVMESVEVASPCLQKRRIWALIGPTGVGKTTTLAKIAAHFSLKVTSRVALITLDTYRIGAAEQLKAYGRILKLPVDVAQTREELKRAIEKNRHQDLLLIDTAGRSPSLIQPIEELKGLLTCDPQIENHLLLSATTKDKDLEQMAQRFGPLSIQSYIFTKIDETGDYAPLLNQLLREKKPISYITNGQKVPEDIELASKVRIANMVLNTIQWN